MNRRTATLGGRRPGHRGRRRRIASSSSIVGWYELRDAEVDGSGFVTGLEDQSPAGNHLLIGGSGDEITLAADAAYGGQLVGILPGGKYLFRTTFTGGQLDQPSTIMWLGEFGFGVAYDAGGNDPSTNTHALYRSGNDLLMSAGNPVDVGDIAEDTPTPTLATFDGATSIFRGGNDWSAPLTVDAGPHPMDGVHIGSNRAGGLVMTGRCALLAIWNRILTGGEVATYAGYMNDNFGQAVTL